MKLIDGNFILFLDQEFKNRTSRNVSYSLRAFARDLGLNSSSLSQIISGKRPITKHAIKKISAKLNISDGKLNKFLKFHHTSGVSKFILPENEWFAPIAHWYFDAVIELSQTRSFEFSAKYVAKSLKITEKLAQSVLETLDELGVLKCDSSNIVIKNSLPKSLVNFGSEETTQALKNYQKEILGLSNVSIDEVPKSKRNHTSFVIAVDDELIPSIKEKILKFQLDVVDYINKSPKSKNKVYAFQISLFPLSDEESSSE